MIGGFRSDLSITCMIDRNFGNVSAGFLFNKFESRVSTKTVAIGNSFLFSCYNLFEQIICCQHVHVNYIKKGANYKFSN